MKDVPVELCELVDADGRPSGTIVPRRGERRADEYFPVIHLWIMDEGGDFLIQRRADHLASDPGVWATTAGYVQAGEGILDATIREAWEEMGLRLDAAQIQPIGHWLAGHRRQAVLLLRARREALGAIGIGPEVSDFRWAPVEAISRMVEAGEFVTYGYFEQLILPLASGSPTSSG